MAPKQLLHILISLLAILIAASVSRADAPVPGPNPGPNPGQWAHFSIAGLETWVYTPSGYSIATRASLMVSLHGCTQSAGDLKSLGNWESAADLYNTVVVLPNVPNGGVILGCWDYYGKDQTESNKNNGPLLALVQALESNSSLWKINPSRVAISGLSSGATEAMLMACLHPDLFSGVGLASGPIVGSDISEISNPRTSSETAAAFCQDLAGEHAASFATQIASIIFDDADPVVNPQHSQLSESMLSHLYQTSTSVAFDLATLLGANKAGSGVLLGDADGRARISLIVNHGIGHAWASGKGASVDSSGYGFGFFPVGFLPGNNHYVNPNSIDYPMYLLGYLSANSLRP